MKKDFLQDREFMEDAIYYALMIMVGLAIWFSFNEQIM